MLPIWYDGLCTDNSRYTFCRKIWWPPWKQSNFVLCFLLGGFLEGFFFYSFSSVHNSLQTIADCSAQRYLMAWLTNCVLCCLLGTTSVHHLTCFFIYIFYSFSSLNNYLQKLLRESLDAKSLYSNSDVEEFPSSGMLLFTSTTLSFNYYVIHWFWSKLLYMTAVK